MKILLNLITIYIFSVSIIDCYAASSNSLWNEECPSAVSDNKQERTSLTEEFPEFNLDFKLQLDMQFGQKISEPNDKLRKEIILTEKVVKEVFKPETIPLIESLAKKLYLSNISLGEIKEKVLNFRVKKDKYIIQFMKRSQTIYVTVRLASGQKIEIPKLAEEIFDIRIWPLNWEEVFYLKRDSKILKTGTWIARDNMVQTPSGEYEIRDQATSRVEWVPIGEGHYSFVTFYTDDKFVIFAISGGPK